MRSSFAFGVLAAAALAGAALAKPHLSPEQDWVKWQHEENAAWATKKFAILKIDDAIYLADGQTAWLTNKKQKRLEYKFTLDALSAPSEISITYNAPNAVVTVRGESRTFELGDETKATPIAPGIDLRLQLAQLEPGKQGLRAIVYNQNNPTPKAFKGLDYFPYNPDAVVDARFEPAETMESVEFQTSRGWYKSFYRAGYAAFTLDGKDVRLPLYTDSNDPRKIKNLSAFFLDNLTGKETYGVGRYVDVEIGAFPPSHLTIDFNRAYNPNCARSSHYNCPVATDLIPVELRAGEKKPPKHTNEARVSQ